MIKYENASISTTGTLVKFHLLRILSLLWEQDVGSSNLSTPTPQKPSITVGGFCFYVSLPFLSFIIIVWHYYANVGHRFNLNCSTQRKRGGIPRVMGGRVRLNKRHIHCRVIFCRFKYNEELFIDYFCFFFNCRCPK